MRTLLIGVSAVLIASGLTGLASAAVNYNASKSNTGNFTLECAKGGGKAVIANGQATCTLPGGGSGSGSGALAAACAKDGGKIAQKGGAATCQYDQGSGMLAGKRTH